MGRQREQFVTRIDSKGQEIIQGNFWELAGKRGRPKRIDLIYRSELDVKRNSRNKQARSKIEQHSLLVKLYNEKLADLTERDEYETVEQNEKQLVSNLMEEWLNYVELKGSGGKQTKIQYQSTVKYYLEAVGDHIIEEYDYKKYLALLKHLKTTPNNGEYFV